MSGTLPANEPSCQELATESIELVIHARPRDLGGFAVRRALPSPQRRLVGPLIFFDHMGPAQLPAGTGFDVRPHPHISLATLTFLFEGAIDHRDSLGTFQTIHPGDVNWMIAGHGIAHSERSPAADRSAGPKLHGIQSWMALPLGEEETAPRFEHHPAKTIPKHEAGGVAVDVIAGSAFGQTSPVSVFSPTLYAHALFAPGSELVLDDEHEERAIYVVSGAIGCEELSYGAGTMIVLRRGAMPKISAAEETRALLVGGARLEGPRHIWWNFVSSSKDRIERAKSDWKEERFPKVSGDEVERIPLPDT